MELQLWSSSVSLPGKATSLEPSEDEAACTVLLVRPVFMLSCAPRIRGHETALVVGGSKILYQSTLHKVESSIS